MNESFMYKCELYTYNESNIIFRAKFTRARNHHRHQRDSIIKVGRRMMSDV